MQEFDLFVIGAGSGGVRCARIAAQNGARVAIAERRHWGGTCVNLGCVPKKLMVYAAEYGREIDDARAYGWDVTPEQHDWRTLIDAKDREIERLNGIYVSMLKKAGVELFTGDARFVDANTVEIGPSELAPDADVQTVRAKNIVIATGGAPTRLDIPGAEHAIVSDDAFHLENRPERVAIIGSGYIGIEFAGIFAGLGSQVDFVYRQDLPLRGFDEEMRRHIAELVPLNGITSHPGSTPERIEGGTYAGAAGMSGGDLRVVGGNVDHLGAVVRAVEEAGGEVTQEGDAMRVRRTGALRGIDIMTEPYPGFPTDMQAQFMALLSVAEGASMITETIFENRFMHVPELNRMGARINVHGSSAIIRGVHSLSGAPVMATDLRASFSLILAGLAAPGEPILRRLYPLDRGYAAAERTLAASAAPLGRVNG